MKKLIIRLVIALVVVAGLAILAVSLFLGTAVKRGVETLGPKLTKVDVKLQTVSLSPLSGAGSIKGLVVGNPEGFKSPAAISIGEASLSLKPASLLADKVIIKSIRIQGPEITYETNLKQNNLSQIKANLDAALGGGPSEPASPKEAKPPRKLQVDEFFLTGGKIHVRANTPLGSGTASVPLPDIQLQDLGAGPDGITAAELAAKVLSAIEEGALKASSDALADIGKGAVDITKDPASAASNVLQKATKSVGDLFKKK
ncbi:MAG TPA: AsmA family protein [Verrucomicrobiota bacterium]|nr:AsmA family protein [Verrucomicrobiota bacterium]